jgi:hypothetical protein
MPNLELAIATYREWFGIGGRPFTEMGPDASVIATPMSSVERHALLAVPTGA